MRGGWVGGSRGCFTSNGVGDSGELYVFYFTSRHEGNGEEASLRSTSPTHLRGAMAMQAHLLLGHMPQHSEEANNHVLFIKTNSTMVVLKALSCCHGRLEKKMEKRIYCIFPHKNTSPHKNIFFHKCFDYWDPPSRTHAMASAQPHELIRHPAIVTTLALNIATMVVSRWVSTA
ncbi:uncharacterized protein TM35_000441060 [Trypanosoma theileri]|uniref:Uncharacterized protein n=1 Tax=Trypanosoma theileri TaxID=67003 RepID=A0A1X0NK17_9TRYP|nr:uncharacterized protein TM35_000441060 [Trypanosoma theileri]ORC84450.1 hypothetical protein TM35_000441060 [Trypanosoma theileri]